MNVGARSDTLPNEKVYRIISYSLVFLMLMCVTMAIATLIANAIPAWHSSILAGVMLLVVADRLYTYPRFKDLELFSREWAFTFAAQWVVLVIFIRLLLSYANGLDSLVADMRLFSHGDLAALLTPEYSVTLLLAMLAWFVPGQFLALLDEIGLDQTLAIRADVARVNGESVPAQQRLVGLMFTLGIVLVLLTVVARIDFQGFIRQPVLSMLDRSRFSAGEAGVLLYFIFGLALLAQGRLLSLETRWNVRRIPVSSPSLPRRWGTYSAVFLILIVLAISLLPTNDSLGIFSVLQTMLGFLWGLLFFLFQIIITIAMVLLSIPLLLLGRKPLISTVALSPPNLPPPPAQAPPGPGSELWVVLRSVLLWGALILIVVFSLLRFLRQHEGFMAALRKRPVLQWLVQLWEWLRRSAGRTGAGLSRVFTEGWQSLMARLDRRRVPPAAGWLSLRSLDPRRRVYFFYHRLIRQSDRHGLTRKPSQTPAEYAVTLEKGLPTAGEDVDSITQAFVEARYSRHAVDASVAERVKAVWERIRRALQSRAGRNP